MGNNADRCFTDLCNTDWFAIDLQMDALQIYRSLLYKSTDGAMHYRSLLYKSTDGAMLCKFRFMFVNVVFCNIKNQVIKTQTFGNTFAVCWKRF